MKREVLSVKKEIGYGMGDAASHIIFDNGMLYMMFFYTDIVGTPPDSSAPCSAVSA